MKYTVAIDLTDEFEVEADSEEEALEEAKLLLLESEKWSWWIGET